MKKARILLALGTWVTILSFLGFPSSWKDILFTLTGLGLVCLSYMLYREAKIKEKKEESFDNFTDNGDFNKNEDVGKIS